MPLSSKSPDCTTVGESRASRKKSALLARAGRPQPNVAAFAKMAPVSSSNATKMPGCLSSRAALTRVCRAKTVLPVPGPPMTRLVRFRGSPPRLISSKPCKPVGSLDGSRGVALFFAVTPAPYTVRHRLRRIRTCILYGSAHGAAWVDKPGDGRCGIADIRRNLFNVECVSIDLRCT